MIHFSPSTLTDLEQIDEWRKHDPYHLHQGHPEWWLGADAVLAFRLMDDSGPLCYVRLDSEGEYLRLHTQFAPRDVVSKRRLIVGMVHALQSLKIFYQDTNKGFVFSSLSSSLVSFMKKAGFKPVGDNDYRLTFEG